MGYGGQRDPSEYRRIMAEVFYDAFRRRNGVRPCAGQGFSVEMKIECSRAIRNYPIGTRVYLDVVETDKEGGQSFLYSSYKWPHEIVE